MRLPLNRSEADSDDFDCAIRSLTGCGRLDWSLLSEPDADLLLSYWDIVQREVEAMREAIASITKTPVPKIYVDFFTSNTANAVVFPRKYGGYWIGVSSGTHLVVTSALGHIFRHRELLPDIGNPSIENLIAPLHLVGQQVHAPQDPTPIEVIDWSPQYFPLRHKSRLASAKQPKNPVRRSAYIVCIVAFFQYLALHEIGHIFKGHLELLRQRSVSALAFSEQVGESWNALTPIESQAIEVDADAWANSHILARWAASGNIIRYRELNFQNNDELNNPKLHLRLWFIIHGLFSWVFGHHTELASYDDKSHPHPDARFRSLFAWACANVGAFIDCKKHKLVWDCLPIIQADILALRKALAEINTDTLSAHLPNLDEPFYSAQLHERVTALSFTLDILTGELELAREQLVGIYEGDHTHKEILKDLPNRLHNWQDRWGRVEQPDYISTLQCGGNIDWILTDFQSASSDSNDSRRIPTGAISQLSLFEWLLIPPNFEKNSSILLQLSRHPTWIRLMATRHYALMEHSDKTPPELVDVFPAPENWLQFLSAVLKAANYLNEPSPWTHPNLGQIGHETFRIPPWSLIELHRQVKKWFESGLINRLSLDDEFYIWVREWNELNQEQKGVSDSLRAVSLINLLYTAPSELLIPNGINYLQTISIFLRDATNRIFTTAANQKKKTTAQNHNSIEAMTYFAIALRIVNSPKRPFLACAYLINRLSIRSCARVAFFGREAQPLIRRRSLAECIHDVTTRRQLACLNTNKEQKDIDFWLRNWQGDIDSFEQYCFNQMPSGATVEMFVDTLSSTLNKIASAYRTLSVEEKQECSVFRAIDESVSAQSNEIRRTAIAARAFLMCDTTVILQDYFAKWILEYDTIFESWVQDAVKAGPAQVLALLETNSEERSRFVWENRKEAEVALELP
jgi:hypothetical protein